MNTQGTWDVAKVRDLMNALEAPEASFKDDSRDFEKNLGVFVTKHEVLMLKRAIELKHERTVNLHHHAYRKNNRSNFQDRRKYGIAADETVIDTKSDRIN